MDIRCYRDLLVWKRAMDLVEECYRLTDNMSRNEEFGLKSQMRRAAVSIPSNIAEGHSRRHSREFLQYLSIALGSLAELETQLDLATRLKLLTLTRTELAKSLCDEVGRMLHGLAAAISRRSRKSLVPSP
jgi:four helix bundle protein